MTIYCHSTFEQELKNINVEPRGKLKLYRKWVQKYNKKQIDMFKRSSAKYIANSLYTKNKLEELFNINSIVIYPPVKTVQSNLQKRKGIITIARFAPEKNLEFNIKVLQDIQIPILHYGNAVSPYQYSYFKQIKEMTTRHNHIKLLLNQPRKNIESSLSQTKVYFSTSKETFGIAVVESIMAGCIPIVPDHTANKETVPFKELRFKEDDKKDAKEKLELALSGDYGKYLPELQEHAKQFTEKEFHKNINSYISKI